MSDEDAESPGDLGYRQQLGSILRRGDATDLREFLLANAQSYGDDRQAEALRSQSDDEMLTLMHRMILARPDLADLHAQSRSVLGTESASSPPARRRPRRRR